MSTSGSSDEITCVAASKNKLNYCRCIDLIKQTRRFVEQVTSKKRSKPERCSVSCLRRTNDSVQKCEDMKPSKLSLFQLQSVLHLPLLFFCW